MFWLYIGEVLKRAFAPTVRVTDGMQIAAASALPAIGKFSGVRMPETIDNDALSYIGAATLAFVIIRLLWAPYAIWKDQVADANELRLALSKPEKLLAEKLVKHRAKARIKLASELEDFQTFAFSEVWEGYAAQESAMLMNKIRRLQAEAGLSDTFDDARRYLMKVVKSEGSVNNDQLSIERESVRVLKLLQRHLVGEISAETLSSQLGQGIETKL